MDEIQNLILQVKGQDELKVLNQQLENEKRLLLELAEQRRTGIINEVQFAAAAKATAGVMTGLNRQIASLNQSFGFSSQSGLQLSYVLDDLVNSTGSWDRHLASISNNIPGLASSFKGMGEWGDKIAAAAGPIGLVSTAIIAMAPLAKAAWAALTDAVPAEIMGELADRAKKLNSELEKLRASKTPEDVQTQKGFEDLFAGQAPEIESGIAGGIAASGSGAQMTPQEKARLERARQDMNLARNDGARQVAEEQLRNARLQIQARIAASNDKTAGELFAQASTNPNVRQRIRDMATANPDGFPRGFASDMASMEPEAMAQADAEAAEFEAGNEEWRRKKDAAQVDRRAKKKSDDEAKKKSDDLERVKAKDVAETVRVENEMNRDAAREAAKTKREADALARKNASVAKAQARQAAREAEAFNKQAPIDNMSQWFQNNVGASPGQAEAMARDTLRNMRDGLNISQASYKAWMDMRQELNQLTQQSMKLQADFMRANNRQLGGDNFSALSPMPGG